MAATARVDSARDSREDTAPGGYGQSGYSSQGREFGASREPCQNREFGRGFEGQSGVGRGHYFGRGPKDYKRSDERIPEDINEDLTVHPDLDADFS